MINILKILASYVPLGICRRISTYRILKKLFFHEVNPKLFFESKLELYKFVINKLGRENKVLFLEFGVFKGESMKYFINNFINKKNKFFGFDSFEGLPEDWNSGIKKKHFNLYGKKPKIKDSRCFFIKGLFQNTLPKFNLKFNIKNNFKMLIHFDADIYSSTLYSLAHTSNLKKNYFIIFDQFTGDESRAFNDFVISHKKNFEILGFTKYKNYPGQVFLKIF